MAATRVYKKKGHCENAVPFVLMGPPRNANVVIFRGESVDQNVGAIELRGSESRGVLDQARQGMARHFNFLFGSFSFIRFLFVTDYVRISYMYSGKNVVERLGNARHEYGAVRFLMSSIF